MSIHFEEDKKTSILFTRSKTPAELNISFQDHLIKWYDCVKYLAFFLDYNLNGEIIARNVLNEVKYKLRFLYR